ncbi:MAG: fasciclin domain-containing protein [Bacteroidales bacterium]|nr:fasciclin domain-containing protein [Bacteroidales bacterium]
MKHIRNRRFIVSLCSGLSVASLFLLGLSGCQEEFDGYYKQPGWVTSSSEDVLKSRGNCKTYLKLVDKTLFKKQVEGSGQYTFLVPTDEAFADFFANNPYGYHDVDDIPEEVAARMVSSWMMYNSYPCDTLSNVLTSFNSWRVDEAFKHMTPSYDVIREEVIDGVKCQVYDYPATGESFSLENNAPSWRNNRYLPVYTERYIANNSITSSDWAKVVGTPFSPYGNYLQAGIIPTLSGADNLGDLYCQNGVIHLVDKVVMPLENMDALIRTYGDGSAKDEPETAKQGAWKLLNNILNYKQGNGEYQFLSYTESSVAAHYFEKAYPDRDMSHFLIRSYRTANNPFLLNLERYTHMTYHHTDLFYTDYNGGMTFYVPQKEVLLNYINGRLFRYAGVQLSENATQEEFNAAFNKMSNSVLSALWFSMQANGMIWPSQFESSAVNMVGSSEHINGYDPSITYESGVAAAGMASNGMWQITNFVPKTAAFEGVAARFLLDPAYSNEEMMFGANSAIFNNMLKSKLAGMDDVDISLILWGNANATWWDNIHYSTLYSTFANGKVGNESPVLNYYQENMRNGYIERETVDALDLEVDPLNGIYGGWAYTNNYAGDVMRYRKSGKTIDGKPEIQIQTMWSIANDANERAWWMNEAPLPEVLQQSEPTPGSYASVVKDTDAEYVNGKVYTSTKHSAPLIYSKEGDYGDGTHYYNDYLSALSYLRAYLSVDSASAEPKHAIFKKFLDYYDQNKSKHANSELITIGSGHWTIFVPTDEALQAAIDYGKTTGSGISLLRNPDYLPSNPTENDANWVDSVIYFINGYITKSGCYPDDGLSAFYEMSEAWDGLKASNRQAPKQYLVTTNSVITDMDRLDADGNVIKAWDGLISGGRMSGYVAKTGEGNKLQFFGRPYTSGAFQVVDVYNANEITDKFDNTVVRQQGQSNIMAPNCMIHSLNGFIIYKIAAR